MRRLIIGGLVAVAAFAAHTGMADASTKIVWDEDTQDYVEVQGPWTTDDSDADRTPYVSCSLPVTDDHEKVVEWMTDKERTDTCIGMKGKVLGPWVAPPKVRKPKSLYAYCGTLSGSAGDTRYVATLVVRARKTNCRTAMAVARAERDGYRSGGWRRTLYIDDIEDDIGNCTDDDGTFEGCGVGAVEWDRASTWRRGKATVKISGYLG